MKKTMHNYRKLLKKNLMLALMFCLTLGIGIFTNSVQVKAANSLKIGNIQAYGGSQVAFEATFKMNGYQKIEIYRSTYFYIFYHILLIHSIELIFLISSIV